MITLNPTNCLFSSYLLSHPFPISSVNSHALPSPSICPRALSFFSQSSYRLLLMHFNFLQQTVLFFHLLQMFHQPHHSYLIHVLDMYVCMCLRHLLYGNLHENTHPPCGYCFVGTYVESPEQHWVKSC